jgi:hypothetical protein
MPTNVTSEVQTSRIPSTAAASSAIDPVSSQATTFMPTRLRAMMKLVLDARRRRRWLVSVFAIFGRLRACC